MTDDDCPWTDEEMDLLADDVDAMLDDDMAIEDAEGWEVASASEPPGKKDPGQAEAEWPACPDTRQLFLLLHSSSHCRRLKLAVQAMWERAESLCKQATSGPMTGEAILQAFQRIEQFEQTASAEQKGLAYKACKEEEAIQAQIVRDVIGNPFRPLPLLPSGVLAWNNGTVRKIAEAIYAKRAFEQMPILADALVEAGCNDETILAHCREPELHVPGCWVLALLLGHEGTPGADS
jgi:hypothetical protein